jgi:predicted NBD/HSP70 family sugar kinase
MDKQYGGYVDHIRIGHADDALHIIGQVLEETEFDPEAVRAVLEALKDAIQRGILQ